MSARALPGERSSPSIDRMLRVNHAGEYGAKRIYDGQLAVLKGSKNEDAIRAMRDQELPHLDYFSQEIARRGTRPSLLAPLWHVGGFALGAASALLGEKAAMACTVAVESVIGEHYAKQEEALAHDPSERELAETIAHFRADEEHHHDTGLAHEAEQAPFYEILSAAVRLNTKFAIWLAERV